MSKPIPKRKDPGKRRPQAPFRLPEGDIDTLRRIYAADEWRGFQGIRDLLEEAYKTYKAEIFNDRTLGLPDTFKELLDKEKGHREGDKAPGTFPLSVYMGTLTTGNYIWEDTETAKEIIDLFGRGDLSKAPYKPPRRIYEAEIGKTPDDVSALILDGEDDEGNPIKKRISETWIDAEFFTNPAERLAEMIRNAKTDDDRAKIAAHFLPTVEGDYKTAARNVAKRTGAKIADVLDPKKRTEKQYSLLLAAVRKSVTDQISTVYKSNFVGALMEIFYYGDPHESKLSSATLHVIGRYAALYFFALHPEIDLRAADELKDEERKEAKAIYDRLLPFMEKALREAQKKKEFLGDWEAFTKFIEAEHPIEEEQGKIQAIVQTIGHDARNALFQLDKVNSNVWTDLELSKPTFGEQMQLNFGFSFEEHQDELPAINTASRKDKDKGNSALILWGLRFDELPADVKITKELTPYDRLCYEAIGALYREATENGGEDKPIFTPSQIYRAMGYTSRPPKKEIDKIMTSLQKMRAAIIYIDNTAEKKINKSYPSFRYEGALLPWDRLTVYVKGKISKDGIRILNYPPLIDFAIGRKQYTSFPLEVYRFPISKSQQHIRLAQYLIEQICHMKNNPEYSRKLTFAKIFERCHIKTGREAWKQRKDATDAIKKLLEYWSGDCAFIGKGSRIEGEFIIIDTAGAKPLIPPRRTRKK